jgi:YHS domain-containing protein
MIKLAKDLVCKMEVDGKTAAATSEYEGKIYYLCVTGCKKAFDDFLEQYVAK